MTVNYWGGSVFSARLVIVNLIRVDQVSPRTLANLGNSVCPSWAAVPSLKTQSTQEAP